MSFTIGAPTKDEVGALAADARRWSNEWSKVTERSVMFLGGQDGPPGSIGGRFDLLDPTGSAKYLHNSFTIPTSELKIKLPLQRDWINR